MTSSYCLIAPLSAIANSSGRAGFGEELVNVALIDRFDGRLLVGVPGEHDPHGVRGCLLRLPQKLGAIHSRHPHVRHDHGVRPLFLNQGQTLFAACRNVHRKLLAQGPLQGAQYVDIIIDTQNFVVHRVSPSAAAS